MEDQFQRWQLAEDSRQRRRKVAASTHFEVHPLFLLPTRRHAACAANYLFGRYPSDKGAAKLYLGGPRYAAMDAWLKQAFQKPQWDRRDIARVTMALEGMSGFWPWPLKHRRMLAEARRRTGAARAVTNAPQTEVG